MISFFGIFESIPGFTTFITIMFVINFIIALTIIFLERKDPTSTLAWIMILFLLPIIGVVLYIFFSQNIARKKIFKLTQDEERMITTALTRQSSEISQGVYPFSTYEGNLWNDLIRLNQTYGRAYYTQDNKIDILIDGKDMFNSLLEDIDNAVDNINVMFFIVKNDFVGKALINALTKKARQGVKVRFLIDALGSRSISDTLLEEFHEAGGESALFFPPRFKLFKLINPKFNYRNHRKLVAIDDTIGYIGGFNIAKEYLGHKKKFGYWRDTHLRIQGGSVQDINGRFLLDWRFAAKEQVPVSEIFFTPPIVAGATGVQIVSSGPDKEQEEIKRAFMKMITSAEKSIYIQTPYFVPDAPILESLKMAAQCGVDVRIMIPCKPDHIFVYWATYSYVGEIIKSGGKVYIYDNGFLHSKMMTIDGEVSTVGSTNFDRRSFRLNFEGNAFIYDATVTQKLEDIFENDMKVSHELTAELYSNRSLAIKMKEPFARLLSGIL